MTILSVGMGLVWFALFSNGSKSFTDEHEEIDMNMMTGMTLLTVDQSFYKMIIFNSLFKA